MFCQNTHTHTFTHINAELIKSEQNFVRSMLTLKDVFLDPLGLHGFPPRDPIDTIFSNLDHIAIHTHTNTHTHILAQ